MSARYEVPVVSKSAIAHGVTEVTLDISKTDFRFKAGQYATITLPSTTDQPTTSQFHDFSIASSPNDHEKLKIAFYYFVKKNGERFAVSVTATPIVLDNLIIGVVEVFREAAPEK